MLDSTIFKCFFLCTLFNILKFLNLWLVSKLYQIAAFFLFAFFQSPFYVCKFDFQLSMSFQPRTFFVKTETLTGV